MTEPTEPTEPSRLQRAWLAWLNSTDDGDDTDGTTREFGDALAELLADDTIDEPERARRLGRALLQIDVEVESDATS